MGEHLTGMHLPKLPAGAIYLSKVTCPESFPVLSGLPSLAKPIASKYNLSLKG
jgi:hypothetical protein